MSKGSNFLKMSMSQLCCNSCDEANKRSLKNPRCQQTPQVLENIWGTWFQISRPQTKVASFLYNSLVKIKRHSPLVCAQNSCDMGEKTGLLCWENTASCVVLCAWAKGKCVKVSAQSRFAKCSEPAPFPPLSSLGLCRWVCRQSRLIRQAGHK